MFVVTGSKKINHFTYTLNITLTSTECPIAVKVPKIITLEGHSQHEDENQKIEENFPEKIDLRLY